MTPTGRIPPGKLRAAVRRHFTELALTHKQLAQALDCPEKIARDWLTYGTAPCAAVLLAAEAWVHGLEHPERGAP